MALDFGANDFYVFASLAIIGTVVAAVWLLWLAQRSRCAPFIHSCRGVAPNYLSVIGVLFALNLVFLANDTWHAQDQALDAIVHEAGSLRSILALAKGLPESTRAKVDAEVKRYVRLTVSEDWPLLARRSSSPATAGALDTLLAVLASNEVGQAMDRNIQSLLVQQAIEVRAHRGQRLALAQTHLNPLKWAGMAFLGFLMMVSLIVVHVDQPRGEIVAVLLFAAAAAPTAAIVLIQGNPFQQPSGVSSTLIASVVE